MAPSTLQPILIFVGNFCSFFPYLTEKARKKLVLVINCLQKPEAAVLKRGGNVFCPNKGSKFGFYFPPESALLLGPFTYMESKQCLYTLDFLLNMVHTFLFLENFFFQHSNFSIPI